MELVEGLKQACKESLESLLCNFRAAMAAFRREEDLVLVEAALRARDALLMRRSPTLVPLEAVALLGMAPPRRWRCCRRSLAAAAALAALTLSPSLSSFSLCSSLGDAVP